MKKRIFTITALLVMLVAVPMYLVACGKGDIVSLEFSGGAVSYKQYTDSKDILRNSAYKATYQNQKSINVSSAQVTIQQIDTSVIGYHDVSVTFRGVSTNVQVYIVAADKWDSVVVGYEQDRRIVDYNSNCTPSGNTDTSDASFIVSDQPYYVGNLNKFVYFPRVSISYKDETGQNIYDIAHEFVSDVKVERRDNNGNYQPITGSALDNIVAINSSKGEFEFASGVEGTFRITQTPTVESYPNGFENIQDSSISATVVVVDGGYNVYTAIDLAAIDNTHIGHTNQGVRSEWVDWRNLTGVQAVEGLKYVILQNDITIHNNDLPQGLFINGDINNGLRNGVDIYKHATDEVAEEFGIIGNYFVVDASNVALVARSDYSDFANSRLLQFAANDGSRADRDYIEVQAGSKQYVRNIRFVGNAKRSADSSGFGGLAFMEQSTNFVDLKVDNVVMTDFLQGFKFLALTTRRTISNSKILESYNFALSLDHAGDDNYVFNSVFKNAGGPLMFTYGNNVSDGDGNLRPRYDNDGNPHTTQNDDGSTLFPRFSMLTADEDSVFENWVSGTEPWFNIKPEIGQLIEYPKLLANHLATMTDKQYAQIIDGLEYFNLVMFDAPSEEIGISLTGVYTYDANPYHGGLRVVDSNNAIVQDLDAGGEHIWHTQNADGKTVRQYADGVDFILQGYGTTRDAYAYFVNRYQEVYSPNGAIGGQQALSDNELELLFGGKYISAILPLVWGHLIMGA